MRRVGIGDHQGVGQDVLVPLPQEVENAHGDQPGLGQRQVDLKKDLVLVGAVHQGGFAQFLRQRPEKVGQEEDGRNDKEKATYTTINPW